MAEPRRIVVRSRRGTVAVMDDTDAPPPPAGQAHLPWLTPRPAAASTIQLLRDGNEKLHADFGCPRTAPADIEAVPIGRLAAFEQLCHCLHRCDVVGLSVAVHDPDRRTALVGWTARSRRGPAGRVAWEVASAGALVDGEDGLTVAALPLPVAKWARALCPVELVRVRTIDAAALVGTAAALWAPDSPSSPHRLLEDVVRATRRLLGTDA